MHGYIGYLTRCSTVARTMPLRERKKPTHKKCVQKSHRNMHFIYLNLANFISTQFLRAKIFDCFVLTFQTENLTLAEKQTNPWKRHIKMPRKQVNTRLVWNDNKHLVCKVFHFWKKFLDCVAATQWKLSRGCCFVSMCTLSSGAIHFRCFCLL